MESQTDITLRQWLRNRPATLVVFEDLVGRAYWKHLDDLLGVFCKHTRLQTDEVRQKLIDTPPISNHEDWVAKPLYRLIDHLTENHISFREHDLPRIERLLSILKLELGPASAPAEEALADFRTFRHEFTWHMEEEETFLFPKIMRTESCINHPELYPEVFKGSVNMFPPAQMRLPEEAFQEMLSCLTQRVKNLHLDPIHAIHMKELLSELLAHGIKLKAHTYLESEILFLRAAKMEEELLKRSAHAQGKT